MTTKFKKGEASPNPKGRPRGSGRPISRLRSTLNKLKRIEPEAIEIVEKVIAGEGSSLDKDQIDMSKWVIQNLLSFTRGAIAEETFREESNKRKSGNSDEDEDEVKAEGTTGTPVKRFSLNLIEED